MTPKPIGKSNDGVLKLFLKRPVRQKYSKDMKYTNSALKADKKHQNHELVEGDDSQAHFQDGVLQTISLLTLSDNQI